MREATARKRMDSLEFAIYANFRELSQRLGFRDGDLVATLADHDFENSVLTVESPDNARQDQAFQKLRLLLGIEENELIAHPARICDLLEAALQKAPPSRAR
jgi:hypothetical protein